ncbi:MAG: GerMN domain-containing protein [Nitrospinae bacterium]|nr:GerMN domain-containing protein [Nitrospinota bacterium]
MSGKGKWIGLATVGLLAGVVIALSLVNQREETSAAPPATATEAASFEATLYLPDATLTLLIPVRETVQGGVGIDQQLRQVVTAVVDPIRSKGLFPEGMPPPQIVLYESTLVLGYDPSFRPRFGGGALRELLAVDALVNSLVATFETVKQVRIVMPGEDERFVSHVDVSHPFVYNPQFVAEPATGGVQ